MDRTLKIMDYGRIVGKRKQEERGIMGRPRPR